MYQNLIRPNKNKNVFTFGGNRSIDSELKDTSINNNFIV